MKIREGAWEKAKYWSAIANCESGAGITTEIVARAIELERRRSEEALNKERTRCASIADSWITPLDEDVEYGSDYWMAHMNVVSCAEHISKAIMDGVYTRHSDISRKTV